MQSTETIHEGASEAVMFTRHEWDGAPQHDQVLGPRFIVRSKLVRDFVKSVRPAATLDIGCGSGNITREVAGASVQVHATDVSPRAIEAAEANLADLSNLSYESINLFDCLPGERQHLANKFDLIVLSEVLEHLDEDDAALSVIQELLPEGGHLLLTVPGDPNQWSVDDELSGHRRRYTRNELYTKLQRAGLEVERITNWGFPVTRILTGLERRMMGGGGNGSSATGRLVRLLLRPANLVFRLNSLYEPFFSFVDAGVGYVVLARRSKGLPSVEALP